LFLAVQKARGGYELRRAFERNHALARELLGMPPHSLPADLAAKIAAAPTAAKATLYDVFLTLCAIEAELSRSTWRTPWGAVQEYFAAITGWGYPAFDVELMAFNPQSEQDVIAASRGDAGTGDLESGDPDDGDDEEAERDAGAPADAAPGEDDTDATSGHDDTPTEGGQPPGEDEDPGEQDTAGTSEPTEPAGAAS
jgi:ParB family chromosome partitioning protein